MADEKAVVVVTSNKSIVEKGKNMFSTAFNFVKERVKSIYLAFESKIKLLDTLAEEFIKDMSSNRNRVIVASFIGVVLIFKFSGNVLLGVVSFVALLALIATWLVFYNKNK